MIINTLLQTDAGFYRSQQVLCSVRTIAYQKGDHKACSSWAKARDQKGQVIVVIVSQDKQSKFVHGRCYRTRPTIFTFNQNDYVQRKSYIRAGSLLKPVNVSNIVNA
jgi:hypothetical protein